MSSCQNSGKYTGLVCAKTNFYLAFTNGSHYMKRINIVVEFFPVHEYKYNMIFASCLLLLWLCKVNIETLPWNVLILS